MPTSCAHLRSLALAIALLTDTACWWYGPILDTDFTGFSDPSGADRPSGTDSLATDGGSGDPTDPPAPGTDSLATGNLATDGGSGDPTDPPAPEACPSETKLLIEFSGPSRPLALHQDPYTCDFLLASTADLGGNFTQGVYVHRIDEQGGSLAHFSSIDPTISCRSAAFSDTEIGAVKGSKKTAMFVDLATLTKSYDSDPLSWTPQAIAHGDGHWLVAGAIGSQVHLAAIDDAPFDEFVAVADLDPLVNALAFGAGTTWVGGWSASGGQADPFLLRKGHTPDTPLAPVPLPASLTTGLNDAISAILVEDGEVYVLGYRSTAVNTYELFLLAFSVDHPLAEKDIHDLGDITGTPFISPALVRVGERLVWTGYAELNDIAVPRLTYVELADLDAPVSIPITGDGSARFTALAPVPGSPSAVLLAGQVDDGPFSLNGLDLPTPNEYPVPFIARLELP